MVEDFKNFSSYICEDDPLQVFMVGETYCNKHFEIRRACSDLNAIEFIIDGSGFLNIEGQHLIPEENDVFILRKGTKHHYKADDDNPWHKYWIVFDGKLAECLFDSYLPKNTYIFKNCDLKKYFKEIFSISRQNISYEIMSQKIAVILLQIFMYIRTRNTSKTEDLADIIKRRLDESIEKPYNLDELCKSVNYSKNYIINVFSEKFGITPYQYFIDKKIEAAKSYLAHTNISIGNISKILNYADQQYFSYCFKKAVGISPLAYRKMTR